MKSLTFMRLLKISQQWNVFVTKLWLRDVEDLFTTRRLIHNFDDGRAHDLAPTRPHSLPHQYQDPACLSSQSGGRPTAVTSRRLGGLQRGRRLVASLEVWSHGSRHNASSLSRTGGLSKWILPVSQLWYQVLSGAPGFFSLMEAHLQAASLRCAPKLAQYYAYKILSRQRAHDAPSSTNELRSSSSRDLVPSRKVWRCGNMDTSAWSTCKCRRASSSCCGWIEEHLWSSRRTTLLGVPVWLPLHPACL